MWVRNQSVRGSARMSDQASESLAAIIEEFQDTDRMAQDADLEPHCELPEFKALLEQLRNKPK